MLHLFSIYWRWAKFSNPIVDSWHLAQKLRIKKLMLNWWRTLLFGSSIKSQELDVKTLPIFSPLKISVNWTWQKFILVKDKLAALSKLSLLPWLQIYHDNKENRRASSDSLMDVYTVTRMASITCWLYKNYVGKMSPFYPDWCLCYHTNNQFVSARLTVKEKDEWKR